MTTPSLKQDFYSGIKMTVLLSVLLLVSAAALYLLDGAA
ncbi:MAG: hypothetical protein RLY58_2250 [Pseudomonadota bacterium]|jgi:hypothetical protein